MAAVEPSAHPVIPGLASNSGFPEFDLQAGGSRKHPTSDGENPESSLSHAARIAVRAVGSGFSLREPRNDMASDPHGEQS